MSLGSLLIGSFFLSSFYTPRGPTPPESVGLLKLNGGSPHDTTGSTGVPTTIANGPPGVPAGPAAIIGPGGTVSQDAILTQVHADATGATVAVPAAATIGGVINASGGGGEVRILNGVR